MDIRLERADPGSFLLVADDGRDLLVQTDWDFPGLASTFGWPPCWCGFTDGTVDCAHRAAGEMIAEARSYLDEHLGFKVDDPGYFR